MLIQWVFSFLGPRIVLWRGIGIMLPSLLNQVGGLKVFSFSLFSIWAAQDWRNLLIICQAWGKHRPGNSKLQCVFYCFQIGGLQLLGWHYSWTGRSCPVPKEKVILVLFPKNNFRVMVPYPSGMRNPFHLKSFLCTFLGIIFFWLMVVYSPFLCGFFPPRSHSKHSQEFGAIKIPRKYSSFCPLLCGKIHQLCKLSEQNCGIKIILESLWHESKNLV